MSREVPPRVRLPLWLNLLGAALVVASGALAARLVWEQTFLTWDQGPQMVGFSLAHGGWAVLLFLPPLLLSWLAVLIVVVMRALILRRRVALGVWCALGCGVLVAAVLLVPYGAWQSLFAARLASGPHVGEFMTYAAATGDLRTVKALIAHGAPVDVRNRSGKTGLHAAAVGDRVEVLEFLLARGSALDSVNRYGDSPLEEAVSAGSSRAAELLESRGAHRIRGTEAHRQKASEDIVRGLNEGMHRR